MNLEVKKKLTARMFFDDNRDQFESYTEALKEMDNVSEVFLDTASNIRKKDGHRYVVNDVGHVVSVRTDDGFVEPVTDFEEDDWKLTMESTIRYVEQNPDVRSEVMVFLNLGWTEI